MGDVNLTVPETIQVPHLTFKDYGEQEFCRLTELLKHSTFPTRVELDATIYPGMETPFTVTIDVLSDDYETDRQGVELEPGQLAVWFAGDVWIFDMNNRKRVLSRFAANISDLRAGEFL